MVRLPDRRSRSADVRVRGSCRSKRRRSRQLCRSDRSRARRRAHLGDGGSGRAHRRHVQGFARATINAAGAQAPGIMAMFGDTRQVPMLKAMNLVTTVGRATSHWQRRSHPAHATLVPWRGRTHRHRSVRTVPSSTQRRSRRPKSRRSSLRQHRFSRTKLTPGQVSLVHRGIVHGSVGRDGQAELLADVGLIEHSATGAYSVLGLKCSQRGASRAHRRHCREAPRRPDQGVADGRTRAARRRDRRPRSAGDRDWP